jgi:hypothetical protein
MTKHLAWQCMNEMILRIEMHNSARKKTDLNSSLSVEAIDLVPNLKQKGRPDASVPPFSGICLGDSYFFLPPSLAAADCALFNARGISIAAIGVDSVLDTMTPAGTSISRTRMVEPRSIPEISA